jgi:hypothetical protein
VRQSPRLAVITIEHKSFNRLRYRRSVTADFLWPPPENWRKILTIIGMDRMGAGG